MEFTDIQYLMEVLEASLHDQDWDGVTEAIEFLKETIEDKQDVF